PRVDSVTKWPGRAVIVTMKAAMPDKPSNTEELLQRARGGDQEALGELLSKYRERLRLMVRLRLDRRLQGRIDSSDVIQEAYLEAAERFGDYIRDPAMPFFLWLRFLTAQKLLVLHRRHLGAKSRDAGREVSLYRGALPEASSAVLAAQLVGHRTSPSQAAMRTEMQLRLQEARSSTLTHFDK